MKVKDKPDLESKLYNQYKTDFRSIRYSGNI